ncbi:class I SAM-dependent methyltransferase [Planktothrix sp. FACHB-1355]|uniref:Class I SAM-dependent methyltransferase n=1 Tax=Aerosakkonema funiforme FACHB-1375 TaxID=2949571 RepID=A0A926ZGY2_9CYAN|nr:MULTISPECIES: methyltransferase domain-containing protein [Oscillatoriales]MBD2182064.1 class I SAM-dependent methyltransferase [Aerosakkonema funiforme FACHB-1375]MBD3560981.1 class I SAM-dependent methyltransferase [Planktothrix sp. FACHB-1355]
MKFQRNWLTTVRRKGLLKVLLLTWLLFATVTASWFLTAENAYASVVDIDIPLQTILSSSHRSDANRFRDRDRHPLETLEFFGIAPDMTVVELWPGSGWYTEILAPFLARKGQPIVTNFDPKFNSIGKAFQDKLTADPDIFGNVKVVVVNPAQQITLAPDNSVDMILTFRNIHNWVSGGFAEKVFQAAYKALKPGGIMGVVEHRAKPGMSWEESALTGYISEDAVIAALEKIGFQFADKSEVNANPKDTKDYPGGVWSLPPTLNLGTKDKQYYMSIGESDRMTLKFIKPILS